MWVSNLFSLFSLCPPGFIPAQSLCLLCRPSTPQHPWRSSYLQSEPVISSISHPHQGPGSEGPRQLTSSTRATFSHSILLLSKYSSNSVFVNDFKLSPELGTSRGTWIWLKLRWHVSCVKEQHHHDNNISSCVIHGFLFLFKEKHHLCVFRKYRKYDYLQIEAPFIVNYNKNFKIAFFVSMLTKWLCEWFHFISRWDGTKMGQRARKISDPYLKQHDMMFVFCQTSWKCQRIVREIAA